MIVNNSEQAAQVMQGLGIQNGIVQALNTYLAPLVAFLGVVCLAIWVRRIADAEERKRPFQEISQFAVWAAVTSILLYMTLISKTGIEIAINEWNTTNPAASSQPVTGMGKSVNVSTTSMSGAGINGYFTLVTHISDTLASAFLSSSAFTLNESHCTDPTAIYTNAYIATLRDIANDPSKNSQIQVNWGKFQQCMDREYIRANGISQPRTEWQKFKDFMNDPLTLGEMQNYINTNLRDPDCTPYISQFTANLNNLNVVCPEATTSDQIEGVQKLAASLQTSPFIGPVPSKFFTAAQQVNVASITSAGQTISANQGYGDVSGVSMLRTLEEKFVNLKQRLSVDTKTAVYYLLLIQGFLMGAMILTTPLVMLFVIIPTNGFLGINLRLFIGWFLAFALISLWYPAILYVEGAIYKHFLIAF